MDIRLFDTLPSTQIYLIEAIKKKEMIAPCSVLALAQTHGVGSRKNSWEAGEGNFFASFAFSLKDLPQDLPLSSASIYFSYIMKEILVTFDEEVWLKWPNDFYKNGSKIGGTITQKVEDVVICGMGINLKKNKNGYGFLESDITPEKLLELYSAEVEKFPNWKQIFSQYKIEFELSRGFSVHIESQKKSLKKSILCEDGSLIIDNKKVFSLR